eukprot:COSAG01_NODE_5962_length_3931_cov_864.532620_4_plen_101_part_00
MCAQKLGWSLKKNKWLAEEQLHWSWSLVFWPWWLLVGVLLAMAVCAGVYYVTGPAGKRPLAAKVVAYSVGLGLVASVPIFGALYLDGACDPPALHALPAM